jgi:hypothetical protein
MTTQTRTPRKLPRDLRARERLREAQEAEARALTVVCAAEAALEGARAKREAVIARATATVDQSEAELAHAQAGLVKVSGLDRASVLLGLDRVGLRRTIAGHTSRDGKDARA